MQNMDFGLTMTFLGMGGTLVILFLISLIVSGLNKYLMMGDRKREMKKATSPSPNT